MRHSYKEPGRYVAICNKTNWDGHYVQVFDFPKDRPDCPPDVDATWYFLNRVSATACVDAVYPVEIFSKLSP